MVVSDRSAPPAGIDFEAPDSVRETLLAMGRTEDIRFSPNGRRLAIACYHSEQIAVADVEIRLQSSGPEIAVTDIRLLGSKDLREPHGLDFVDDETLVAGNRGGGLCLIRLSADGRADELTLLGPNDDDDGSGLLDSPGSVAARPLGSGSHEVLACNNWSNTITRHTLAASGALTGAEVVFRKRLDLPDGLAVSGDGRWLAVSNHNTHSVLVYAHAARHESSEPVGVLRGVRYPHGLRFGVDDGELFVADAGAPHVYVFAASAAGWAGARYPVAAIRVMDASTFRRGNHTPAEGGPKGIDVHLPTRVLASTSEHQPLSFFDLREALDANERDDVDAALLRYELLQLDDAAQIKADAAAARAQTAEVLGTKTWRLTASARRVYGALRSRARHRNPPEA